MSEYMIEIQGLRKTFKKLNKKAGFFSAFGALFSRTSELVHSVDGIDLRVRKGEIRGLIGPNGAGKSTTIKIMSGILHPTEGTVSIMGYTPWLHREKYIRNLGVLFGQKSQLWWDLPPIDTFELNREMYRIPTDRFKRRLDRFVELLQIERVIYQPVRTLSLGERMKCELVCALLHEPSLIFLDEPTIGLDIVSKETIRQFIKQTNKELQTTFIITTHDLADLENLCDNVTIINKGSIVFDDAMGKLSTFFRNRKIIEVKFAEPVGEALLDGYDVIEFGGLNARIEVNVEDKDIKHHVYDILGRLPVVDINITNIPIEEVIKHIYTS
ncbi:ABC transporter ATP-binding protein [Cohnella fermenti]|uniref:ATP-binding cassette domain-containing protein n=1 Tax=Cohnella fermenti TaxID=2565925 RepID=A0A4S4BHP5_9BACL|nr:ATP-binding cassette domain-containing protein [Cohnella fermenti]THF74083.1 ATP-binding cassette domain-containing protein [Cohnella fermenti]